MPMEDTKPEASPPEGGPTPPKKSKTGLWIAIVVIVIVVALLALYFAGVFTPASTANLPTAVYLVGYAGDGEVIMPEWWTNRAQWPTQWLFSEGLETQSLFTDLVAKNITVQTILGTAPTSPITTSYNNSVYLFNQEFQGNFSHTPGLYASQSYDAVMVAALAMVRTAITDPANALNTNSTSFKAALRYVAGETVPAGADTIRPGQWAKAVGDLLNGTPIDFYGASGATDFDQYGNVGSDYMVWGLNATNQIYQKQFIPEGTWLNTTSLSTMVHALATSCTLSTAPIFATILPLSGTLGAYGPDMQNGTILAAQDINQHGGICGQQLQLLHYDDATTSTTGATDASTAISAGAKVIIGSAASSVSLAVFAKVVPAGIIEISPASTSPAFDTLDTTDQFWRTAPSDALQGRAAAWYAYNIAGWRTVSVLYVNNPYGVGLGQVFANDFKARGGQVYRMVAFDDNQPSYTAQLQTLFTPGISTASLNVSIAVWQDDTAS